MNWPGLVALGMRDQEPETAKISPRWRGMGVVETKVQRMRTAMEVGR